MAEELDRRGAIVEELLDTIKGQHSEDVLHEQKMQSVQNTVDMLQKEVQMLESRLYVGRRSLSPPFSSS